MPPRSRSWPRWRRARRPESVANVAELLRRRLDPAWRQGEPSLLFADWREGDAALQAGSPDVAEITRAYVGAIAAAGDAAVVQAVRNAALSRENGAFTEALALVPTL